MIKPKGEWKQKNNRWYKAVYRKTWQAYSCQECVVCHKSFLTRHENQTCSRSCGATFRWQNTSEQERWKTERMFTKKGYVLVRDESEK